jgi:hypothetical protein
MQRGLRTVEYFFSLFSYFEKMEQAYEIRFLSVCVCVCARACLCIPLIVARQRLSVNVTKITNTHATTEELLDSSFSM